MKYLVMECHISYAVLLDEEGHFVKAANLHYEVGQTVEDPVLMEIPLTNKKNKREIPVTNKKINRNVIMSMATVAAACFILLFHSYYLNYMRMDTSIYLNINPSICMELNKKGNVIRLIGANEDGKKLLENYKRSSNDRLVVTDELIDRAIEMGFLSEGGRVVIDIDAPDEAQFQRYGIELRSNLTEYLESQLTVDIQIIKHELELLEETVTEPKKEETVEPEEDAPEQPEPTETTPKQSEPIDTTPKQPEPTETTPNQSEPVETAPKQPEPTQSAPEAPEPKQTAPPTQPEPPVSAPKEEAPVPTPAAPQEPDFEDSGYTDYGNSEYGDSSYSNDNHGSGHEDSGYSNYDEGANDTNYSEDSSYSSSDYNSSDYDNSEYE